jgi:cytochrome c oxidase subunit 1
MTHAAWGLALVQLVFIVNLFASLKTGRRAGENPWQATTLEWSMQPAAVYRPAYEYSVPGAVADFVPQDERTR